MRNISIVKDKTDGTPFAVIVINKAKNISVFGSKGQGETWAEWVNSSEMSFDEAVNSLDLSLVAEKPLPASSANTEELAKFMRPEEVLDLQSEINKKAFLEIVETKSLDPVQENNENDVPDFTPVSEWPITDVQIASIDVLYKQNAVDYKAKAFIFEKNISSLMYEVKGYRAVWDPNISSWRCPTDTVNGGQFTSRMGRGCTTGMVRRLGQFLMSVDDRNTLQPKLPGIDEPRTSLYRAGKLINSRAEVSREKFVGKTKNRANRRQQRSNVNPRFTDLYGALNPDKPALQRARTAAGLRLQRMGGNIAQDGFAQMQESGRRKARRLKKNVEAQFPGGAKGQRLRELGGIIPNSRLGGYVVKPTHQSTIIIDLNEMVKNSNYLKGLDNVFDREGELIPNPVKGFNYITRRESAEIIRAHQMGLLGAYQNDKPAQAAELGFFNASVKDLLLTTLGSDWEETSTGQIHVQPYYNIGETKSDFYEYDDLQIQKAKYAKGGNNSEAMRHSQGLQSFEKLEKLDPSDSRVSQFEAHLIKSESVPKVKSITSTGETYLTFSNAGARRNINDFIETLIPNKEPVSVRWNMETNAATRRSRVPSLQDATMDIVIKHADHFDNDGNYLFTTVHSVPNGGTQDDIKTEFYALTSKASESIANVEAKKSIKDGEISQHFRLYGGKNPLTNRGGFVSVNLDSEPVDLDAMIPLNEGRGATGLGGFDSGGIINKTMDEWRAKGWSHVSRDEWHEMENNILENAGETRDGFLSSSFASDADRYSNSKKRVNGLGGDSPLLKRDSLSQFADADVGPESYVRALSAKDYQNMLDTKNVVTMSHLNNNVWKKAIRRKEKESGKDYWGNTVGSDESRLNRIRQNFADFIESFDPLADDDTKNRRMRRRVEKRSSKIDKNLPDAANAHDVFGELGEEGKLNIEQLLSLHRDAMDNFFTDLAARGRYKGVNESEEAFFSDSNQEAGKPSLKFEQIKQLVDSILDDNDVFGADPERIRHSTFTTLRDRTMQDIARYAAINKLHSPVYPLIHLTNFRIIEKIDGKGTKKVALREFVQVSPYMMESYTDTAAKHPAENGIFAIGIHTAEITDLTDDEIVGIESGQIQFDDLRDRFTAAVWAKKGHSPLGQGRGTPQDGGELMIAFDRSGDPLLIDGGDSARIPYRGSKNDKINITTGGVSGKIRTSKGAELEADDTAADFDDYVNFWDNNKKAKKRMPGRRDNTGATPETPGIIERFLTGDGRRWTREREASERLQQGRMPRSTDSIRERFFKRLSQISNRMKSEEDPIDLYPTIPSRVNAQDKRTRVNGPDAIWGGFSLRRVIKKLGDFPVPPDQNAKDWKDEPDNVRRIADLSDSLEVLGGWRPRITQEDRDREEELREMHKEWEMDLHNPSMDTLPGADFNYGHAIVAEDTSPNYDRIVIYDARLEHKPPVAVIDEITGTTHFLDKDGKHLMSMVLTEDVNGNRITVPIIGPAARRQFEERARIPGFIERMTGKFRKRKPRVANTPVNPSRLTRRGVIRSKSGRTGISYPQRSTGDYLQTLNLTATQRRGLHDAVSSGLDSLEKEFRSILKLSEADELLEDDILDHIDDLAKSGNGRLSGMRKSALHDMLVLAEAKESSDLFLINDLKPTRRNNIIKKAGINTGVDITKNRRFTPYGPTRPPSTASQVRPTPAGVSGPNVPTDFNPGARQSPPRSPRAVTGPALTSGIGNPALNISFLRGHYVDDTTGEIIEDLSGLETSPDMVYTPHTIDVKGSFPSIPAPGSIKGILPRRITKIAPGVDPNHPDLLGGDDARRAIQVTSVTQSFDEAAQALKDAGMGIGDTPLGMGFAEDVTSFGFDISQNRDMAGVASAVRKAAATNSLYKEDGGLHAVLPRQFDRAFADSIGLGGPGPVRDMYLPTQPVDLAGGNLFSAAVAINKALKAQHIAEEMERELKTPSGVWDSVWGSGGVSMGIDGASTELDITVYNVKRARDRADAAWDAAAKQLAVLQQASTDESNRLLKALRLDYPYADKTFSESLNRKLLNEYIRHGQTAEIAEHLLRKHILSDPSIMDGVADAKRKKMEDGAKRTNERNRARANRIAAGRRDVGQLDGKPVLDFHGSGQVSNAPQRTVQEIMDISAEHKADGVLEAPTVDPITGVWQEGILTDEDIEILSSMGRAHAEYPRNNQTAGHPDLVGTNWHDIGSMMMGSWWLYSGFSSLPLLVDEPEIVSLLNEKAPDGEPFAMAIVRGVKDDNRISAATLADQALRGDRFVPGQGSSATGRGEYWTGEPSRWGDFLNEPNGQVVAVLTRDSKIMTAEVADALFTGTGGGRGDDSLLYGALWSLSNAHGAPDFDKGVNINHGKEAIFGVPENSLLPDPNTGLYDIPALQAVVDRMTDLTPGQEGIATLEGWDNANQMPSWLMAELFPKGAGAEVAQEAQELRQQWNAWLGQHLSWFVQLAQMARDESQPGQAGTDAKEWNTKLNEARRTLLYMSRENRLATMHYDAAVSGDKNRNIQKIALTSRLWTNPIDGLATNRRPNVILIFNRSSGIYYRLPTSWQTFRDGLNNRLTNGIPW